MHRGTPLSRHSFFVFASSHPLSEELAADGSDPSISCAYVRARSDDEMLDSCSEPDSAEERSDVLLGRVITASSRYSPWWWCAGSDAVVLLL